MNLRQFMENTGLSDEQAIKILAQSKKILTQKIQEDDLSIEVMQKILTKNLR